MANWTALKAAIADVIKTNGNQEITGVVLQNTLNNIISNIGKNAQFVGVANLNTNPGTPDGNVFYLASEVGVYSNFGGITTLPYRIYVLYNTSSNIWASKSIPLFPSVFDVSRYYTNTDGDNIFTFDEAISKVSAIFRYAGLKVLFLEAEKQPRTYEFIGGSWTTINNWRLVNTDTTFLNINLYNWRANSEDPFPYYNTETDALLAVPITLRRAGMVVSFALSPNKWKLKQYIGNTNNANDELWKSSFIDVYSENTYTELPITTGTKYLGNMLRNIPSYKRRQYMPIIGNIEERNMRIRMMYMSSDIDDDNFYNTDNWEIIESTENLISGLGVDISGNLIKDKFVICNPGSASNNGTLIDNAGSISTGIIYCKDAKVLFYTGYMYGNTGVAFYDKDKKYIGRAEELIDLNLESPNGVGLWLNNYPIKVLENAYYFCASSRANTIKENNYIRITSNSNYLNKYIEQEIKDYFLEFDGISSYAEFKEPIVLQNNGDYLEYKAKILDINQQPYYDSNNVETTNCLYSLIGNLGTAGVIGNPTNAGDINMRLDDGSFIKFTDNKKGDFNKVVKRKFLFTETNIEYYENDILINSVPHNNNTFTISKMGNVYKDMFIKAYIKDITIKKGTKVYDIGNILHSNDIIAYSCQLVKLENEEEIQIQPQRYCIKTENELKVYYKRSIGDYICYHLYKRYMEWDEIIAEEGTAPNYYDNWGIEMVTQEIYNNGNFSAIKNLYRAGETELALRLENMAYVGGATHGYENIDNSGGVRKFNIFINGIKIDELGTFNGEFDNIEVNMLSKLSKMQTQEDFCSVSKKWIWDKDGLNLDVNVTFLAIVSVAQCQMPMLLCLRKLDNFQITGKAVKSDNIYTIYDVSEDDWINKPENSTLRNGSTNTKFIREWSDYFSFELNILSATYKSNGGMFVTTNDSVYNKIYNNIGSFTTNINDTVDVKSKFIIN